MMKKEATRNMIEFAWGIADFLGLDEPNYDDFEETRCFISHNVPFFYEKLEEVDDENSCEDIGNYGTSYISCPHCGKGFKLEIKI